MKNNDEKSKKIAFETDKDLCDALQAAREAGKLYNNKRFSNRLAYEIGVKVLLEIDDEEEEEALNQKLADIRIQKTLMDNQENLILASLEKRQAKKQQEIKVCAQAEENVKRLAERIIKEWNAVKIYKKDESIGFIFNMYPDKLNKARLEKVFSEGGLDAPTTEEALKIASDLLGAGKND